MGKIRLSQLNKKQLEESFEDMMSLLETIDSKDKTTEFFLSICAESEVLMMARRIQIVKKIILGESYEKIRKDLNVGYSTIAKMDEWLRKSENKYSGWIKKCLDSKNKKKNFKRKGTGEYYESSLDKYPGYRLLKQIFGIN